MPFGLRNVPATFERLMEREQGDIPWTSCLVYLDEIVTYCDGFETALGNLKEGIHTIEKSMFETKTQ